MLYKAFNRVLIIFTGTSRTDHGGTEGGQRTSRGVGPKFCGRPGGPTTVGNPEESSSTTVGGTERPAAKQVLTAQSIIILYRIIIIRKKTQHNTDATFDPQIDEKGEKS